MNPVLITGGAGFFGHVLARYLLDKGLSVVSIDRMPDNFTHENYKSYLGDIRDAPLVNRLFDKHRFEAVYHCAAILAHVKDDMDILWSSNVDGTAIVAEAAKKFGVKSFVFISSNCLWAENLGRPVREDDTPAPIEIYGRSKWEGEKILERYGQDFSVSILRTPTIMDEGRLGLLTLLFDFIREGRKVWVVGGGANCYQFIYAKDLADACERCTKLEKGTHLFNIGSDDVKSFRDVYSTVIEKAGTKARVASLPKAPTIWAMKIAYALGLSPLGPYQYKMIAEDFVFDTSRIKEALKWKPSLRNEDMLWLAYQFYARHYDEIVSRKNVSAHNQPAKMGIIKLLKWIS
ncbi:MAG: NAD(P)-dependent oxidoreductase [Alphaproteobacteria bacterium]|nr:NAD(P)-dependent oxidoreductase [Alphaproteobacteria bacterium]